MENSIEQNVGNMHPESERYKKAHRKASAIFDEYSEAERILKILEDLKLLFKSPHIHEDQIRGRLEQVTTTDKSSFVNGVINAVQPILDWAENYPEEYEQMQRENVFNQDGHVKNK